MGLFYTLEDLDDFIDSGDKNMQEFMKYKRYIDCTVLGIFLVSVNFAVINYFT